MEMMRRTLGRSLEAWWTSKDSQGELEAQSKSSSSLLRSPGAACSKNNATATYGVRFGRSLYEWKDNFKDLPMAPVSGPNSLGVNRNRRNNGTFRICHSAATPSFGLLAQVSYCGPWWMWLGGYARPNTHIISSHRHIRVRVLFEFSFLWRNWIIDCDCVD